MNEVRVWFDLESGTWAGEITIFRSEDDQYYVQVSDLSIEGVLRKLSGEVFQREAARG